jgi:hypothetical protein
MTNAQLILPKYLTQHKDYVGSVNTREFIDNFVKSGSGGLDRPIEAVTL